MDISTHVSIHIHFIVQTRVQGTNLRGRSLMRWTDQMKSAVAGPLHECTKITTHRVRWWDIVRRDTPLDKHSSWWPRRLCPEFATNKRRFTYVILKHYAVLFMERNTSWWKIVCYDMKQQKCCLYIARHVIFTCSFAGTLPFKSKHSVAAVRSQIR